MPIFLKQAIEPGSTKSRKLAPILAESNVSQRLRAILRRYVQGNVTGRSFLISGHRGAGKTTLVKKVVHEVAQDFRGQPLRPLLVVMSGPMLLPPGDSGPAADETKVVLEQLTVNLYRTLARHFADSYADYMRDFGLSEPTTPGDYWRRMEIADDFRQKLDGPVELAELRAFWQYAGGLNRGILFSPDVSVDLGQGTREIVALWSCLRAYLSLAADFSEKSGSTDSAGRKSEISAKSPVDKGFVSALLGVGSGSAVGAGLLASGRQPLFAAISAIATAVGSAILLNFSVSRNRESANTLESTITIKRDLQSLARELPELLQRCRDAGIVPVFLIDELDKVDNLEERIQSLIFSTKLLVTEQSVFFFVTDRSYYEYIDRLCRETAYPREHTFFSERLFVSYQPGNWRSYISEILIPGSSDLPSQELENQAIDILSFALMCRSRMHAIDLRRAIGAIAEVPATPVREDVESIVNITPDELVKQRRFLFEVLIQVAVEVTLAADPDFSGRCVLEPPFTQVAFDALYYLARKWESSPKASFVLEEGGFREWLDSRSEGLASEGDDKDISFLLHKVEAVLFFLRNPTELASEPLTRRIFKSKVIEMVQATPALISTNADGRFEWLYDIYGRPLHPETVTRVLENQQLAHDRQMIRAVQDTIKDDTGDKVGLGAFQKVGLLPATPPVQAVFESLERLKNLDSKPVAYPQMDEDLQNVTLFAALLRERGEAIVRSIVAAWLLSRSSPLSDEPARFLAGWGCLADRLSSKAASTDQCCEFMRRLYYSIQGKYTAQDQPYLSTLNLKEHGHEQWRQSLHAAIERIRSEKFDEKPAWSAIEAHAWQGWAATCLNFLQGHPFPYGNINEFTLDELLASAHGNIAARWLKPDLSAVPIADWSTVIFQSLQPSDPTAPLWAAAAGLMCTGNENMVGTLPMLQRETREGDILPDLVQQAAIRVGATPPTPRPRILVLRAVDNSITANWPVELEYACLIFTRQQRGVVTQVLTSSGFAPIDFILIEPEASEPLRTLCTQPAGDLVKSLSISEYSPTHTRVGLLAAQPSTIPSPKTPLISVPLGVKDSVTRLLAGPRVSG